MINLTLRKQKNSATGFTLIEILVSLALFGFVMLATTSTLLSLVDANHRAQSNKTAIDNLSLVLESMTRNIRTGSAYAPLNAACSTGGTTGISFKSTKGDSTSYSLDATSGAIVKIVLSQPALVMTSSEISIDRLCFYIEGNDPLDAKQPVVLITVGGVVNSSTVGGTKTKTKARFDIQTTVSQRILDI